MKKTIAMLLSFLMVLSFSSIGVNGMENGSANRQTVKWSNGVSAKVGKSGEAIDLARAVGKSNYLSELKGVWAHHEHGYIVFDGMGYFYLIVNDAEINGEYDFDGKNITLYYWGKSLGGWVDSDGDLLFEGLEGWFSYAHFDGLEGIWEQSDANGFIFFDGRGYFYLCSNYNEVDGTYTFDGENIYLNGGRATDTGRIDSEGNILFNNMEGWYAYSNWSDPADTDNYFLNYLDGLQGIWDYTDGEGHLLIDGLGSFYIYLEGETAEGYYSFDGEDIYFYIEDSKLFAWVDSDGDIAFADIEGWFTWSCLPW